MLSIRLHLYCMSQPPLAALTVSILRYNWHQSDHNRHVRDWGPYLQCGRYWIHFPPTRLAFSRHTILVYIAFQSKLYLYLLQVFRFAEHWSQYTFSIKIQLFSITHTWCTSPLLYVSLYHATVEHVIIS